MGLDGAKIGESQKVSSGRALARQLCLPVVACTESSRASETTVSSTSDVTAASPPLLFFSCTIAKRQKQGFWGVHHRMVLGKRNALCELKSRQMLLDEVLGTW